MILKRTHADPCEVRGYGTVKEGGTIEVPDHVGATVLAMDGWEEVTKPARAKRTAPETRKPERNAEPDEGRG